MGVAVVREMFLFGVPEWIILAATACVLLYLYASRDRNYWKNQNVLSEPFALIFGPTLKIFLKPMHEVDFARYKKYGKLFGGFEAGKAILFVADPELVKQVLVKDFALLPNRRSFKFNEPLVDNMIGLVPLETWRRLRPAASPAFSTGKLRKMNELMAQCAMVTAEHIKEAASKEEGIDVREYTGTYALDVTARCAFGMQLDSKLDATNEFVTKSKQVFRGNTLRLLVTIAFPAIARALRIRAFNQEIFKYYKSLFQNVMNQRQNEQCRHEDFLQYMIDAQKAQLASEAKTTPAREDKLFDLDSEVTPDTSFLPNKGLTEDEALAQCVSFFVAGLDGTTGTIANVLYLLAIHPDKQAILREEVDECFATHGDFPSLDAIAKMNYLHCVVSESLRLYPPASRVEREASEDYTLHHTGIKVRKGDLVAIPVYGMHHDPEYFPDPLTFKPERFSDENLHSVQPYTYMPFGAGPRNCIGMRFAIQATKVAIIYTIRSVELVRTEKTKVPLTFHRGMGGMNAKDMTVGVRKRVH